ncbi:MAG: hypothetical protein LBQ66_15765 [Planctomycetaceae bacterium]|nr:hypothetical protein [Planctomycetaceae bacterium]
MKTNNLFTTNFFAALSIGMAISICLLCLNITQAQPAAPRDTHAWQKIAQADRNTPPPPAPVAKHGENARPKQPAPNRDAGQNSQHGFIAPWLHGDLQKNIQEYFSRRLEAAYARGFKDGFAASQKIGVDGDHHHTQHFKPRHQKTQFQRSSRGHNAKEEFAPKKHKPDFNPLAKKNTPDHKNFQKGKFEHKPRGEFDREPPTKFRGDKFDSAKRGGTKFDSAKFGGAKSGERREGFKDEPKKEFRRGKEIAKSDRAEFAPTHQRKAEKRGHIEKQKNDKSINKKDQKEKHNKSAKPDNDKKTPKPRDKSHTEKI